MKRQDVVRILNTLLPVCQAGERHYQNLADRSGDAEEKAIYIHSWQKYAQCLCEIEDKIRIYGGRIEPVGAVADETNYEDALSEPLPVDIRTVLQTHMAAFKETRKRTDALRKAVPLASFLIPNLLKA